jgi:YD repeat-containing protein
MPGGKPYLLCGVRNNLGQETTLEYAPSTKYYLEDRAAGRPWVTRLSLVVQVLAKVVVTDEVTGRRLVSRYRYHHGYFDGPEREFRGFGRVEQEDAESFEEASEARVFGTGHQVYDRTLYVPPVLTRTWYHTGAYLGGTSLSRQFAREYYRADPSEPSAVEPVELPDTVLPSGLAPGLSPGESREAVRALRGRVLHQEVYALDLDPVTGETRLSNPVPYTVSERSYGVRRLQPKLKEKHAAFFVYDRESVEQVYERDARDPRVSHSLTLEVDEFGNVRRKARVGYGRRTASPHAEQGRRLILVEETDVSNDAEARTHYRVGTPVETRSNELRGAPAPATGPNGVYTFEELDELATAAPVVPYEAADTGALERRQLGQSRTYYYADDLSGRLELGQAGMRALVYEIVHKAVSKAQVDEMFGPMLGTDGTGLLDGEGAYTDEGGTDTWWTRSSRAVYDAGQFYLPVEALDPFGNVSRVSYDAHALLVEEIRDPMGNVSRARNDYRVLAPWEHTDPNGNRRQAAFDALGLVERTAVMGKEGEADPRKQGDTLEHPGQWMVYDLWAFVREQKPARVRTFAREEHHAVDPIRGQLRS